MSSSSSACSAFPALIPRACPRRIKQFNKGQSNPTYFIEDTAGDRWVLRKQPPGKLLKGAHAVDREFRVFSALADTDVPVPKMLLFCDDPDIIGTPFCARASAARPPLLALRCSGSAAPAPLLRCRLRSSPFAAR